MPEYLNLDDVDPDLRFRRFCEVSDSLNVPTDLRCETPEQFRFHVNSRTLGEVRAGTALMTQLHIERTPRHIARSQGEDVKVVVPVSGEIVISQDKKRAHVQPGQFYLVDPVRPYEETITQDLTFIWMHVPRKIFASALGPMEVATATGFGHETPYARLTIDYMHSLSRNWDGISSDGAGRASSVALDLIAMTLWERTDRLRKHSTVHRTAQFQLAKRFIDDHLAYPLTTADVAASVGVSARCARALLAEGGLNFRQYLLEQRLKRCALDLTAPRFAHRTITDIAYSWGFFDSAHFSHGFKQQYGMCPRDYRAQTQLGCST